MEVNFRVATLEDVEKIIALCNECFTEETDVVRAKESFQRTEKNPNDIYLVGELDGNIIAHCKVTIIETMYHPMGTYSILNHVCVKPEYRRHRIATKMLDVVTDISLKKGCNKMELWSNNVRTAAHACYYDYGFQLDDAGFFSKVISE